MGASGWDYVTRFDGSVERALENLHTRVFQQDYGDDDTYETLEDLYTDEELMEEGTHSILDIERVVHIPDTPSPYNKVEETGILRPLAPDRIVRHFGTERPTPEQFQTLITEANDNASGRAETLLHENQARWTGLYVVLYTGDEPTHLGVFGCSGD
ncbi:hypothetical protein ACKI1I_14330 [Streptomyces turgidiscabies]|uniref:Uncharacterized protein n=1 Tax=Streptomyces turgidiscabies (strain Car8) TaxID=698760 RepID=L7F8C6_STRT8|nr:MULTISPECIES: hypothetical protein [Streptomyces]ELP66925.1 hypothetical protein STRTUCAR8_06208 [Streptomyces turgidiscabies Car8]MDX3493054.1 hypothetical protein [Streptomyces turgidiscabies]GAQ77237.1 hypothetical protein T45_09054 [Streptomyces turgidiscabies]